MIDALSNRWQRNFWIRRYAYGPCLRLASAALVAASPLIPRSLYALKAPIFIVGCSRSGTTVFVEWFRTHPDLCDWSEGAQVLDLDFYSQAIDHCKDESDVNAFERKRIGLLFGLKTRLLGKARFVNKHPENSFRIRFLKAIFPDALFVHLVREAGPTILSNLNQTSRDPFRRKWPFGMFPKPPRWRSYLALSPLAQFSHQWVDSISYIRECVADGTISRSRYLEIHYEDFCANPENTLSRVYEFCGLDPLRKGKRPRDQLQQRNPDWRLSAMPHEVAEIDRIAGSLNAELGYAAVIAAAQSSTRVTV